MSQNTSVLCCLKTLWYTKKQLFCPNRLFPFLIIWEKLIIGNFKFFWQKPFVMNFGQRRMCLKGPLFPRKFQLGFKWHFFLIFGVSFRCSKFHVLKCLFSLIRLTHEIFFWYMINFRTNFESRIENSKWCVYFAPSWKFILQLEVNQTKICFSLCQFFLIFLTL